MNRLHRLKRSTLLLLAPGLRGSPGWMKIALTLQLGDGLTAVFYPVALRLFTDGVTRHDRAELTVGVFTVAALFVASFVFIFLGTSSGFVVQQRADLYLATRIAKLVHRLPGLEHFERSDYLRELDVLNQERLVLAGAPQQILSLFTISVRTVVMVAVLATVSPYFALLPVASLAPFFCDLASVRYRKRRDEELAESVRLTNRYFELASTAASAKELRTFGLVEEIAKRRTVIADKIVRRTTHAGLITAALGSLGWLVFAAAFVTLMFVVITQAIHGHASPGQVLMVLALVQMVQFRLSQVADSSGQLMRARLAAYRLVWLEDEAAKQRIPAMTTPVPDRLRTGISLEHVGFVYPGTEIEVLTDVSLQIPAGSSVAVVGDNGAGKTTLAKLLSRMYAPSSGIIRVDTVDLGAFDIDDWRARITSTFQDFARYQFRAGRSIGIGDFPRMDDDNAALLALRNAGAESVLSQLGRGLDTQLGHDFPDGQDLSGGEWQKIALGRGRMRADPLLIILDEPTASLDPQAESLLFDQYVGAARQASEEFGTITVLVSHRFSTVRMADLIIVLENGRVSEFGSHRALLEQRGTYARLFSLQERAYR